MRKQLFCIVLLMPVLACAQQHFWKAESENAVSKLNTPQSIIPKAYKTLSLAFDEYKAYLKTAPKEVTGGSKNGLEVSIPYPDNSYKKFRIQETKMMEDPLAMQFENIKTYLGQGIDDPASTIRIDYTNQGFHAFVLSQSGAVFIDPYQKGNNDLYISYFASDCENPLKENSVCRIIEPPGRQLNSLRESAPLAGTCIGTQLKTYRAAISCTGEYAVAVCPSGSVNVANTMSAIVTTLNRINGVYQTELGIKLELVGANASIIYTNPATDPYTGNSDGSVLINESQTNITNVIGSSNFDIGHTFSTGGGGVASIGVVCNTSNKARGVTGTSNPVGDVFNIDYVAHEIGHQFGAFHSFESETNSCGSGNRSKSSAYEVGGGTTIMSYSGICGSDNIQANSNPYFHTKSFDDIIAYTTSGGGAGCPVITATGNHPPSVVMPETDFKIPMGTPFTLTGTATDVDGDALSYCWEEWDLTNANTGSAWNSGATSTVAPLFKSRVPKPAGSRAFPDISVILANYPSNPPAATNGLKGETLPQVARDMKFRLVVRDNNAAGGGVATGGSGCSSTAAFKVVVTDDGPFKLSSPNTAVNWLGGSVHDVTWDVANTDAGGGINVQNVDILMSTDGGNTYPTTVVSGTPNDGSKSIVVPNIPTNNTVRFMVRASGNIFFDISDVNFTITFNSVLPVSLLYFSASPHNPSIVLTWATATEANNKGFEILRSDKEANNFTSIGFVAGAGNSSVQRSYTYSDNAVKKDVLYFYRLRQVDADNHFSYSAIESANIGESGIFSVSAYPQPFYDKLLLSVQGIAKKNFTIIISDITGRILKKEEVNNSERSRRITVDAGNMYRGVYLIKISQDRASKTVKAVKL